MDKRKDLSFHRKRMGTVLREAREEKQLSVEQLAAAAKLNIMQICCFELGLASTLTVSELFRVAVALGIDKIEFVKEIMAAYYAAEAQLN